MNIKGVVLIFVASVMTMTMQAGNKDDYKQSSEYIALRDSVHHSFNASDSARFFVAVKSLENYLLKQEDLHEYYTQRCNEIVFQLNRQKVFEAYKLATQLSKELTEKKLDKEMYMAINMMGHIYHYSGNKESAKQCFWEVIRRMEQEGYTESLPPIYMNLVNIVMDEDPKEALRLIDQAASIAKEASPDRVFDIETRRTLAYYLMGDTPRFLEGYEAYRNGIAKGLSSIHGRELEIYYLVHQGKVDEAINLTMEIENPYGTQANIYSKAGRWKEAYEALTKGAAETDSMNSMILSSSMQGIQNELKLYDAERRTSRLWLYGLIAIAVLLFLLVVAMSYIVRSRRRHLREMKIAYEHALESDRLKTAFIKNVSHEVRTPLNIISGFAQVMADPGSIISSNERRRIADAMMSNTHRITSMINEVLEMSVNEASTIEQNLTAIPCNILLHRILEDYKKEVGKTETEFRYETSLDDAYTVLTNESCLRKIIHPLLDNAEKNAKNGIVTLRCSLDASHLIIMVEDNGSGVPVAEAEHIFERFVKLDPFKEGVGLGLTFSRMMAHRLGGDVRLDTTYAGPGARFEVTIPLK